MMITASSKAVAPVHPGRERVVHIQYLRGIAAMMVVLHHALHQRIGFFSPLDGADFGRPGVLIFFVISGFIMLHACRGEPPVQFALRRAIRVVPLYWIMTSVFFVIVFRNDLAAGEPARRVPELIQSLLFLPQYHAGGSGDIWPILVPGWTLNFEMFFFVVFGIGIAVGRPGLVSASILAALLVLGLLAESEDPLFLTWTNPFLVLFIGGMALAYLRQRLDFGAAWPLLPVDFSLILVSALGGLPADWTNPAYFIAAMMIVAGTLALHDRLPDLTVRSLAVIGDASYSIYLSHTILMIFLFKALALLPLNGWAQFAVVTPVSLIVCALFGIGLYFWLERPLIRGLRRRLEKPR